MKLKDIVSLDLSEIDDNTKDEIYGILSETNVDTIPKKHLRRILEISIFILKLKNNQALSSKESIHVDQLDSLDDEHLTENEKLQIFLSKLENENKSLKTKIEELNEENLMLQKRLDEIGSDKDDSSDPLSEIDRREELLKNISTKNKHIKRLLRDIENLEKDNIEQSKIIIDLEIKSKFSETEFKEINEKCINLEKKNTQLSIDLSKSNDEISRLEGNLIYLEDERERTDFEFKTFLEKLEERAIIWKKILDEKEDQLETFRIKYEKLCSRFSDGIEDYDLEAEMKRLIEAVQERDSVIEELENKLRNMAKEMMTSTELMNKIALERENEKKELFKKNRSCCKNVEENLTAANVRCKELSEMLEIIEEDNILKAKQASEAIATLKSYQSGHDGLAESLKKVSSLEQKLNSRDKQIKALVMEINSLHDISQENTILRKKLNIPDDVVVSTKNLIAKQRNKDKMIERLTLKLRASEEMRLQLKIDKNELKREIDDLRHRLTNKDEIFIDKKLEPESPIKPTKEIYCDNCLRNIQILPNRDSIVQDIVSEWETKYSSVVDENENLRVGMHEILEKIREYDESSEHITIDCTILEKLLYTLNVRNISTWYHPTMDNNDLLNNNDEQELGETINLIEKFKKKSESFDNDDISISEDLQSKKDLSPKKIQKSPKKIEENKEIDSLHPIIVQQDAENSAIKANFIEITEKYRKNQIEIDELRIYKLQFEELMSTLKNSDENEINNYCRILVEKITEIEMNMNLLKNKYEFLKDDYDREINESKMIQINQIAIISDLKKEINIKKYEIDLFKTDEKLENQENICKNSEHNDLQKEYFNNKIKLANLIEKFYSGKIPDFDSPEINIGIIKDNLQLDFITIEEYHKLESDRLENLQKYNEISLKNNQLEDLLRIAQEQIKSQQKLLSEITETQINLRHLVADLQSSSEDKFIIAKTSRDLEIAKQEINKLKSEKEILEQENSSVTVKLNELLNQKEINTTDLIEQSKNNEIKIKFLKNSLYLQYKKYCTYTPLILLEKFVVSYSNFMRTVKTESISHTNILKQFDDLIKEKLEKSTSPTASHDLIKLVKFESKCKYLEEQAEIYLRRIESLQTELDQLRLSISKENEHWDTVNVLFGGTKTNKPENSSKSIQTLIKCTDASTNTEEYPISSTLEQKIESPKKTLEIEDDQKSDNSSNTFTISSPIKLDTNTVNVKTLESQLKKAMNLASMRSALLLETENRLAEAQGRIKEMEKIIENKSLLLKQELEKTSNNEQKIFQTSSGIIEATISSLQSLLSDKDNTVLHYQELLRTEREQHVKSCENFDIEISALKRNIRDLETAVEIKDSTIGELKLKTQQQINTHGRTETEDELKQLTDSANNFNEISDEKIEEMFLDEHTHLKDHELSNHHSQHSLEDASSRYIQELQTQLREANNREMIWEKTIRSKDEELNILKEKHNLDRGKIESFKTPEIEQLQILLEEKDKHINDMMETLTSFHDDQQRFITETSLYSVDQVSQLGANLTRTETTNRVLSAQIEALRKQVSGLTQREKQARDLVISLKNQLIKRPVVSIKTELNARTKTELLQKRIHQLESELNDAKKEIKKQTNIIDAKRAKSATDLALWEKQKRWQQNAEKLKEKLNETEAALEKNKIMLSTARNTISRLEKEKRILEMRYRGTKCCRTPSCPNLMLTKYAPSETPESFTVSECGSPIMKEAHHSMNMYNTRRIDIDEGNNELLNVFKSRIEAQQRRIIALELESKGSNALTTEIEKLQEKLSSIEAQNIRLEARNLQLQLDNDLIKQEDEAERLQKRIKHLEDYILAIKEELSEAQNQISSLKQNEHKGVSSIRNTSQAEQTILALRNIIDRLKVENKNLKENRKHFDSRLDKKTLDSSSEISRLQHMYAEALDKISALQIELQIKNSSCPTCKDKIVPDLKGGGDLANELKIVKEKLIQKTQLLEKAKILLTRAAAKEKNLKEQITIWKLKCAELQNVPVIEETSE